MRFLFDLIMFFLGCQIRKGIKELESTGNTPSRRFYLKVKLKEALNYGGQPTLVLLISILFQVNPLKRLACQP
jgi:hypothetical protein